VYPEIPIRFPKKPVMPMTLTNTTKKSIQNRTERSEVHSRPKGGNPQDHSRTNLNQKLIRIHQKTGSFAKVQEELIRQQWETNIRPHWFITLLWNYLPTRYDTAHQLRRSRTGTLDFLITHYEWFQNNRSEVVR
jgi:hypothetical protein